MKKITLFILFLLTIQSNAQTPSWAWAKSTSSDYGDYASKTIIDSQNNIYILGSFSYQYNIENITLSGSNQSYYLTKLNPSGNVIWSKKIDRGSNNISNFDVTFLKLDDNDNILLGGTANLNRFSGNLNYNDELNVFFDELPYGPSYRYFSMKIDSTTGAVDWYDTDYGTSSLYCGDIDDSNNYYLFGEYDTSISIEGTLLNSTTSDGRDFYILKKNNNNLIWAKPFNFYLWAKPVNISCDLYNQTAKVVNNQYLEIVAQTYSENFSFQNNSFQMGNPGSLKLIILKLDLDGNFISFNYFLDCPENDYYNTTDEIHVDESGNVYMYGMFTTSSLPIGTTTLNKIGESDVYVAKLDSDANLLWAKSIGVQNFSFWVDCFTTHNDTILLGAEFSNGSLTINNTNHVCNGVYTTLLLNLDDNFNFNWTKSATGIGSNDENYPRSLAYNKQNEIIMTGGYNCQNISFDNFNLLATNNTNTNYYETFIAKLTNDNLSNNEFNKNLISLYPNPVKDNFSISGIENLKDTDYYITDTSGRIIRKGIISDTSFEVSNLKTGIYFFHANNGFCQKFIKE